MILLPYATLLETLVNQSSSHYQGEALIELLLDLWSPEENASLWDDVWIKIFTWLRDSQYEDIYVCALIATMGKMPSSVTSALLADFATSQSLLAIFSSYLAKDMESKVYPSDNVGFVKGHVEGYWIHMLSNTRQPANASKLWGTEAIPFPYHLSDLMSNLKSVVLTSVIADLLNERRFGEARDICFRYHKIPEAHVNDLISWIFVIRRTMIDQLKLWPEALEYPAGHSEYFSDFKWLLAKHWTVAEITMIFLIMTHGSKQRIITAVDFLNQSCMKIED